MIALTILRKKFMNILEVYIGFLKEIERTGPMAV
jgi:hypothetical protein